MKLPYFSTSTNCTITYYYDITRHTSTIEDVKQNIKGTCEQKKRSKGTRTCHASRWPSPASVMRILCQKKIYQDELRWSRQDRAEEMRGRASDYSCVSLLILWSDASGLAWLCLYSSYLILRWVKLRLAELFFLSFFFLLLIMSQITTTNRRIPGTIHGTRWTTNTKKGRRDIDDVSSALSMFFFLGHFIFVSEWLGV
jgi:hypothetical protein